MTRLTPCSRLWTLEALVSRSRNLLILDQEALSTGRLRSRGRGSGSTTSMPRISCRRPHSRSREAPHSSLRRGLRLQVFHNRCARFPRGGRRRTPSSWRQGGWYGMRAAGENRREAIVRPGFARISATCRTLLTSYYVEGTSRRRRRRAPAIPEAGVEALEHVPEEAQGDHRDMSTSIPTKPRYYARSSASGRRGGAFDPPAARRASAGFLQKSVTRRKTPSRASLRSGRFPRVFSR